MAAIAWIVGVQIIPEALEMAGYWALALLALGMAFPYLIGRIFHLASSTAHVALAAVALVLHAVIDGIALLPASGDGLAIAVILHRIPVGMAIWWTFRPGIGDIAAVGAFVLVIAATAATYFFGATFIEMTESRLLSLFQAFVAGALVNLVLVKLREIW